MKREWETYVPNHRAVGASIPYVRISTRGTLSLNGPALALLGQPNAVIFVFDADGGIGVRASSRDDRRAYAVTRPKGSRVGSVAATRFLTSMGVDYAEARTYDATLDGDVLVLDVRTR